MTFQSQPLHLLVKRNTWEPKHEWESRLLFVEEHLDKYGLEKAIHLSLVWANVNFLGCSYPSHTQELVSEYPLPDQESLRVERKKRERAQRKRRGSSGDGGEGEDEAESKRVRTTQKESEDALSSDAGHNSSAEDTDTSFEHVSLQVDALISAIRKQHEKKAEEKMKQGDGNNVPQEVLKMLQTMCMCHQCFSPGTSPSSQVNSIVQRYVARFDKNFHYDFTFQEDRGVSDCRFLINGQSITKGRDANRKIAKQKAAEQFVQLVNGYYKSHGKPCCPHRQGRRNN